MDVPHLRLALMTNNLIQVDTAFSAARQVVLYDVAPDRSEFVDVIPFGRFARKGPGGGPVDGRCVLEDMGEDDGTGADPIVERVEAVDGCSILFALGLSDLAAVRVHARKVFPVKSERVRDIDDVIAEVQRLMAGSPPLWLRRVMRSAGGERLSLDEQGI